MLRRPRQRGRDSIIGDLGGAAGQIKPTESHEIGGGGRSPGRIVLQSPPLGALWLVAVAPPVVEITKRLVFSLVKLSVELDQIAAVVAMERPPVMARPTS